MVNGWVILYGALILRESVLWFGDGPSENLRHAKKEVDYKSDYIAIPNRGLIFERHDTNLMAVVVSIDPPDYNYPLDIVIRFVRQG